MLAFFLVLVTFSAYILVRNLNAAAVANARNATTAEALAEAKAALIDYAVTFADRDTSGRFGYLPCPDTTSADAPPEGIQAGACGAARAVTVGRLPWKSLGIEPLRDGYGECLWYVVSGDYKEAQPLPPPMPQSMLNEDSNGFLDIFSAAGATPPIQVTGPAPETRAVAAVLAAGPIVSPQARAPDPTNVAVCGGTITPGQYLENFALPPGADTVATLTHARGVNDPFNDRIAFITRDDIFNQVRARNDFAAKLHNAPASLAQAVAQCAADYNLVSGGNLPWAAPLNLSGLDYRVDASYTDAVNQYAGRLPNTVNLSGPIRTMIVDCPAFAADAELVRLWQNWKDHLFYAVAHPFSPDPAATGGCAGGCLTVNGGPTSYAAVVLYSRERLGAQLRNDKSLVANYLEGVNPAGFGAGSPSPGTSADYNSLAAAPGFNDVAYCIDTAFNVAPCCLNPGGC